MAHFRRECTLYCHTPPAIQTFADERGRSSLPTTALWRDRIIPTPNPTSQTFGQREFPETGRARCPHRAALPPSFVLSGISWLSSPSSLHLCGFAALREDIFLFNPVDSVNPVQINTSLHHEGLEEHEERTEAPYSMCALWLRFSSNPRSRKTEISRFPLRRSSPTSPSLCLFGPIRCSL